MEETGKALRVLHTILIVSGIAYCFGFALYQFRRSETGFDTLGLLFAVAGVMLTLYLRSFLRYGLRGKPRQDRDEGRGEGS